MRLDGHKPVQKYMLAGPHSASSEAGVPGMAGATVLEQTVTATEELVYGPFLGEKCQGAPLSVLGGVARCGNCVQTELHATGGAAVAILGPFPWENKSFQDGYHCGDPLPQAKWTQPPTSPPGYRPAGKMASCLPGRAKYSGALYSRIVGVAEDGSLIVEEAPESVTGPRRTHGHVKSDGVGAMASSRRAAQQPKPVVAVSDGGLPIITALDDWFECGECGHRENEHEWIVKHIHRAHPQYREKAPSQGSTPAESGDTAAPDVVDVQPVNKAPSGFKFGGWINNPEYASDAVVRQDPPVKITLSGRALPPAKAEAPPKPAPRPEPRIGPSAVDGLPIVNECSACGGTGRVRKKRWAKRWNGQGDGYRLAKCQKCKAGSDGRKRPDRPTPGPVPAERPVRKLSEVMGALPSERKRTRPDLPAAVVKTVDEAESFMWAFLGAELPQPTVTVDNRRISELEQMVRQRDASLEAAKAEMKRLQGRIDELEAQLRAVPTATNDARIGQVTELETEVDRFRDMSVQAQAQIKELTDGYGGVEYWRKFANALGAEVAAYKRMASGHAIGGHVIEGEFANA